MKKLMILLALATSYSSFAASSVCLLNTKSTNVQDGYLSCSGEEDKYVKPADELLKRLSDGYEILTVTPGTGNNTNTKWGSTYTLIKQ